MCSNADTFKGKFCTPDNSLFANEGTCEAEKLECLYGFNENHARNNYCSCQFDQLDMIVLKHDADGKTKSLKQDLIEFNKAAGSKVSNIATNSQYTIEFWLYSQQYVSGVLYNRP